MGRKGGRNGTAAGLDTGLDDRKAEAGSARAALARGFWAVEWFKNLGKRFRWNTGPGIRDEHVEGALRAGLGFDADGACRTGVPDGVADDICQSPFQWIPEDAKREGVWNGDFDLSFWPFAGSDFRGE